MPYTHGYRDSIARNAREASETSSLLDVTVIEFGNYVLTIGQVLLAVAILLGTRLLLMGIKKMLDRNWRGKQLDKGTEYAVYQIIKYFLWVIAVALTLESIGIGVTAVWAGSTALLVGLGFGIQQTFNDLVSGIILLFEGSIKVDDVIEVDGEVVRVKVIGLRTSKCMDRDGIMMILPNSRIVTDKVINWSHNAPVTRFRLTVGVAYGSNIELVMKSLVESALEHHAIYKQQPPKARLIDFADSSLNFELLFYSKNRFRIEQVRSDIRVAIDTKFRENGISIPFPQRDLHVKSGNINFDVPKDSELE